MPADDQSIATLSVADLRSLIREEVEKALRELVSDPEAGLSLRPEVEARITRSVEYVQSGGRLLSVNELNAELDAE